MIQRVCPYCKMPNHSSDESSDWKCLRCGATITKEYNQPSPNYTPATVDIFSTKMTSARDWAWIEHLISNILQALVSKCCDMRCAEDCVVCPIIGAKKDAGEIVKLMEELR